MLLMFVKLERPIYPSSNPTPAADQIDSDEDSDGTRNPTRIPATASDLQTPPNSFVDPSAFKQGPNSIEKLLLQL